VIVMRKVFYLGGLAVLLVGCPWLKLEPNYEDLERGPSGPIAFVDGVDTGQQNPVIELSTSAKRTVELTVVRTQVMTSGCRGYAYGPKSNVQYPSPFISEIGKDDLADFPLPDLVRVVDTNSSAVLPPTASVSVRADFTQVSRLTFEALKPGTALVSVGIVCYPGDVFGGVAAYSSSQVGLIRLIVK
jgi:hypothetical protein